MVECRFAKERELYSLTLYLLGARDAAILGSTKLVSATANVDLRVHVDERSSSWADSDRS